MKSIIDRSTGSMIFTGIVSGRCDLLILFTFKSMPISLRLKSCEGLSVLIDLVPLYCLCSFVSLFILDMEWEQYFFHDGSRDSFVWVHIMLTVYMSIELIELDLEETAENIINTETWQLPSLEVVGFRRHSWIRKDWICYKLNFPQAEQGNNVLLSVAVLVRLVNKRTWKQ